MSRWDEIILEIKLSSKVDSMSVAIAVAVPVVPDLRVVNDVFAILASL